MPMIVSKGLFRQLAFSRAYLPAEKQEKETEENISTGSSTRRPAGIIET